MEYKITGMAPLIIELLRLMREDMVLTTLVAAAIIFGLLVLLERSLVKGILVFIPLIFALTWTFGTMGFLNIPVAISTVVVGAILLGLGVEYGIFMVSRYYEERKKRGREEEEALKIAVSNIGASTFGSAATTTAAFLTLTLSVMPMVQHLGQTLALGIVFCWLAAVVVNPCFIVFEDRVERRKLADRVFKWANKNAR